MTALGTTPMLIHVVLMTLMISRRLSFAVPVVAEFSVENALIKILVSQTFMETVVIGTLRTLSLAEYTMTVTSLLLCFAADVEAD
jgi:hypothetical protein